MKILIVILMAITFLPAQCRSVPNECPSLYLRYSLNHSYCAPANNSCQIFYRGVTQNEINFILRYHNDVRSVVATGKETKGGGLPKAANMLEMVWDTELASVAQKRAENCVYEHDCSDCRRVGNFAVGQNIAYTQLICYGKADCKSNTADWNKVLTMFYEEVKQFQKKWISPFQFQHEVGHFTQMIWADTWRLGCGFVAFSLGNGYRHFFVCNYGPAGNIYGKDLYKKGEPCSKCPSNTCCGKKCKPTGYAGLCRMTNPNEAPVYKPTKSYLLFCDFRSSDGDCSTISNEANRWQINHALGGSHAEIILKGGEKSVLYFSKQIKSKGRFCLVLTYRTGPTLAGQIDSNSVVATYEPENSSPVKFTLESTGSSTEFMNFNMDLLWGGVTKFSIEFSVPVGAPAQFLNIDKVAASEGKCTKAED
ncbi:CRISP/Allergen/PR-1-like [Uloborus diversus]|uniref:CRISP/Allergen/PR-1-like n=1 Tax=Uloborus diversus TaxID=327109 RepID=UPI0024097808|nr:CRISP/Allergen/PR-1-like [Uloborus diversus]